MAIWKIFGHLVFFSRFGMFYRKKSGNPAYEYGANPIFRCFFVAPKFVKKRIFLDEVTIERQPSLFKRGLPDFLVTTYQNGKNIPNDQKIHKILAVE
jgi:hypothetical protein